ncbi:MAG: hypothetical protein FH756_20690 [Firmicutes bacterium]|nr:hypothetical protein [Bacillota bacterium]
MSFDIDGFLGEQMNEIIQDNYSLHENVFKLCEEVNRYSQKIKYGFNINSNDLQGIITTSLYLKIHNTYQASVIMYKYGLNSQAKICVRAALESLFVLRSIVKDKRYVYWLLGSDSKKRELLLKRIIKNPHNVFNSLLGNVDVSQLDALIAKNRKDETRIISPKEWAEISESYSDYYYAYDVLCGDVHVDIRNMEQYVATNDEGEIEQFNPLPSTKDIEAVLFTANYVMVGAIKCMSKITGIDAEGEVDKFETMILKIKDEAIKER